MVYRAFFFLFFLILSLVLYDLSLLDCKDGIQFPEVFC